MWRCRRARTSISRATWPSRSPSNSDGRLRRQDCGGRPLGGRAQVVAYWALPAGALPAAMALPASAALPAMALPVSVVVVVVVLVVSTGAVAAASAALPALASS